MGCWCCYYTNCVSLSDTDYTSYSIMSQWPVNDCSHLDKISPGFFFLKKASVQLETSHNIYASEKKIAHTSTEIHWQCRSVYKNTEHPVLMYSKDDKLSRSVLTWKRCHDNIDFLTSYTVSHISNTNSWCVSILQQENRSVVIMRNVRLVEVWISRWFVNVIYRNTYDLSSNLLY